MSQADYKDLLEKKGQPSQLTQAGARPVSDSSGGMAKSVQKLSVNSVPEAADIEVDGAFVGSTPSVLELNTGEHSIVVHKTGYKTWERKLQLATGEIKVTAELEKSASPN
jgi:CRISPR/Cas system-associated exonuclease Cas4 (RecB family)